MGSWWCCCCWSGAHSLRTMAFELSVGGCLALRGMLSRWKRDLTKDCVPSLCGRCHNMEQHGIPRSHPFREK